MAFQTTFTPLNTYEMVPVEVVRPDSYHNGNIDQDFQRDLIKWWEESSEYLQPVERGDKFRFQVSSTTHLSKTLTVVDCNGLTVLTIALTNTATISGNVSTDGDPMGAYDYRIDDPSIGYDLITEDGTYYLLYAIEYDATHTEMFISQPFDLKDAHEDTVLIEYRHSINKERCYFEQIPTIFRLRIGGTIPDNSITNESSDTVFEDQGYNLALLNSVAYNGWKFFVGINGVGLSAWMFRKLNYVFGCDELYIDGKGYQKGNGARWEKTTSENVPLFGAAIDLRLPDNSAFYSHVNADLDLYTAPGGYPYAIPYITISNGVGSATLSQAIVINDLSEETAFIADLNNSLPLAELTGSVVKVGSVIRYINGQGEKYNSADSAVYTDFFSYEVTSSGFVYDTALEFANGAMVADWGDGDYSYDYSNTFLTNTFLTHQYSGPATWSVRMFHTNNVERIVTNETTADNFGDVLPTALRIFYINYATVGDDLSSFDFGLILPCTLLEELILHGSITTITNIAPPDPTPFGTSFRFLNITDNLISSTDVDDIIMAINDTVQNNGGANYGTLYTYNQSPGAPPSFSSYGAINDLITNYSWNVQTD